MAGGSAYFIFEGKDNVSRAAKGINRALGDLKSTSGNVSRAMARNFAIVGAAAAGAAAIIYKTATGAAEQIDALNAGSVIFGKEAGNAIAEWANNAAFNFGASKTEALGLANALGGLAKAAGKSGEDAAQVGMDLSQMAGDLASFYGGTTQEAAAAIQSFVSGTSTEPIRKYQVFADEAQISMKAVAMGLVEAGKNGKAAAGSLTPQIKMLARLALLNDAAAIAQGDFAKTSDQLKNSIQTLTAGGKDVMDTFGLAFQDVLAGFAKEMKDNLPTIKEWAGNLGKKIADVLPKIANTLKDIIPKLVEFAAKAVDTAAKLWGDGGSGPLGTAVTQIASAIGKIGDAIGPVLEKLDELMGKADEAGSNPLITALVGAAVGKATGIGGKAGFAFGLGAGLQGDNGSPLLPLALMLGTTKMGGKFLGKALTGTAAKFGGGQVAAQVAGKVGGSTLLSSVAGKVGIGVAEKGAATVAGKGAAGVAAKAGAEIAGVGLAKGLLKRIPVMGSLIAGGATLAMGGSAQAALGSTIGSAVGGVAGAAIGTALLGPIGGAIGGFLGSTAGDIIGTAIGDVFTDHSGDWRNAGPSYMAGYNGGIPSNLPPAPPININVTLDDKQIIKKVDVAGGRRGLILNGSRIAQ